MLAATMHLNAPVNESRAGSLPCAAAASIITIRTRFTAVTRAASLASLPPDLPVIPTQ
jgi:hypothetical protein